MARIVGAFAVPHTPHFPIATQSGTSFGAELSALYAEVKEILTGTAPDTIVIFSDDHFNTFVEHVPVFCIGKAPQTQGPFDYPDAPAYQLRIDIDLAEHIHSELVAGGIDLSAIYEFSIDHSFTVPYHFLAAELDVSIVPIFINGLLEPLPTAERCHALGRAVARAIGSFSVERRIAVIASGSLSLDLGGIRPGQAETPTDGVPDPGWVDAVIEMIIEGRDLELVGRASPEQLRHAGNVGGEVLNWIAMLGAAPSRGAGMLRRQGAFGHAFGGWKIDACDGGRG